MSPVPKWRALSAVLHAPRARAAGQGALRSCNYGRRTALGRASGHTEFTSLTVSRETLECPSAPRTPRSAAQAKEGEGVVPKGQRRISASDAPHRGSPREAGEGAQVGGPAGCGRVDPVSTPCLQPPPSRRRLRRSAFPWRAAPWGRICREAVRVSANSPRRSRGSLKPRVRLARRIARTSGRFR